MLKHERKRTVDPLIQNLQLACRKLTFPLTGPLSKWPAKVALLTVYIIFYSIPLVRWTTALQPYIPFSNNTTIAYNIILSINADHVLYLDLNPFHSIHCNCTVLLLEWIYGKYISIAAWMQICMHASKCSNCNRIFVVMHI